MRPFVPLVLVALACAAPAAPLVAHAEAVVSMGWNNCNGPVNVNTTGGGPLVSWISVLGQSVTAQSYQLWAYGGAPGPAVPDAWRFDPGGCEGSSFFTINTSFPIELPRACGVTFQGNLQSLEIKDYAYEATTNKARIVLANAYPNNGVGNPNATNPLVRYVLASWYFDLTFATTGPSNPTAGTCGGIEAPMCWALTKATWLDTNYNEFPWTHGQDWLTINDPNAVAGCPGAVPARTRTWGEVKHQYR